MNKLEKQLYIISIILLILLSISLSHAYNSTTLKYYYTSGDGIGANGLYDTINQTFLSKQTGVLYSQSGIQGQSIGTTSTYARFTNASLMNFGNPSLTFNYWLNFGTGTRTNYILLATQSSGSIPYYVCNVIRLVVSSNSTSIKNINIQYENIYCSGGNIIYSFDVNDTIYRNDYNMITITYDYLINKFKVYYNGYQVGNYSTSYNIPSGFDSLTLYLDDSAIDEFSIFNSELNSSDILKLFNNHTGLNFNQTLSNSDDYNSSEEYEDYNYSFDGFYHDYCWYYILCQNYNVSNDVCDDSPRKVCSIECADTFDIYQSLGEENNTASFSGICYNDTYYYEYPSYVGISGLLLDLCLGNYLCHFYNISGQTTDQTCPNYYHGGYGEIINKINCITETGSIVAECFDTFDIYNEQGTYPPNNNYSGYCSECKSDCNIENATSCYDSTSIQKCQKYHNCLKEFTIKECDTNYYCFLGSCLLNTTQRDIAKNETCVFCLFDNLTENNKYGIMIISSVLILIVMTILLASFGQALAGLFVGLLMSMIVSLTLTLIFDLSLLIPILYIIIGGAITTVLIRKIFTG